MSSEQTDAVYARAGWGGAVERGVRPAIVVIDFSVGFTDPACPIGADYDAEVAATARLIEAARPKGVPVLFTTIAYAPGGRDGGAWLRKAPGLAILEEGSELVEIDARLPRAPADPLIVKKGASGFFGTNLAALLAAERVDTVIVCGATTSGCVRASVVDAVQSGFPALVPRECVGDRAPEPHAANLFDIDAKYGEVVGLDEMLAYVRSLPAERPA